MVRTQRTRSLAGALARHRGRPLRRADIRVGLNVLHLVPGETGGGELYVRRLIPALLDADPSLELVVFGSREGSPSLAEERWPDRARIVELPVIARSRVRRVLGEQTALPAAARRAGVDLLHNLFTTAPAFAGSPQVTTILDVIYKRFPDTHKGILSLGMTALVPLAARRSARVITISRAARDDIVEFLGVPTAKIDVTPLGPGMPPDAETVGEDATRQALDLGDARIVLSVSARRAHKNLDRLLEAFASIAADDVLLVLPGYPTHLDDRLHARADALGLGERVRFTGWLEPELLNGLYEAATCFVFPSLAEGFGLPVLEAMVRGTPVACSDASSLPEVAGDAARYFDPTDVASITGAIQSLLDDSGLRERLAARGIERSRGFTWTATANATLATYERALEGA